MNELEWGPVSADVSAKLELFTAPKTKEHSHRCKVHTGFAVAGVFVIGIVVLVVLGLKKML